MSEEIRAQMGKGQAQFRKYIKYRFQNLERKAPFQKVRDICSTIFLLNGIRSFIRRSYTKLNGAIDSMLLIQIIEVRLIGYWTREVNRCIHLKENLDERIRSQEKRRRNDEKEIGIRLS